jgi:hypothetical protein
MVQQTGKGMINTLTERAKKVRTVNHRVKLLRELSAFYSVTY